MAIEFIRAVLAWCALINIIFLLLWFLFFALAHDLMYRVHSRWFKLSVDTFDAIHYAGIVFFKIGLFLFNLVPYFALRILV